MSSRPLGAKLRDWAVSNSLAQNSEGVESGRKLLSADLWSFGIGAAVAGYFSADYLGFYSPVVRATAGLAALIAIVMVHLGVSADATSAPR